MIRFAFSTLKTDIERYQTKVANALREYSAKVEKDAKWYKEDICAQRKQEHLEAARKSVKDAEASLALACRVCANKMRDCLKSMTTKPVDPGFLENMRTFREFGIKLNKNELPMYINQAAGNLTALRVLEEVAKASGFKLKYTGIDAFSEDVKTVEQFGAMCQNYAPEDLRDLAKHVLPDAEARRDDGTVMYSIGRPTFTSFILSNARINSMLRDCEGEMLSRWTTSEVPDVEEFAEQLRKECADGEPDGIEDNAQAAHEKAVETAAGSVDIREESGADAHNHAASERAARSRATIEKYM